MTNDNQQKSYDNMSNVTLKFHPGDLTNILIPSIWWQIYLQSDIKIWYLAYKTHEVKHSFKQQNDMNEKQSEYLKNTETSEKRSNVLLSAIKTLLGYKWKNIFRRFGKKKKTNMLKLSTFIKIFCWKF